jgi:DNA-directed RNA polymerase specialized sigma subunit
MTEQATEHKRRLKNSASKARSARNKADALWDEHKELIRSTYAEGTLSLQQIADVTGVTKARVWQIVKNYTPPEKS